MPEALILPGMADAEPDLSTFENKTGLAEDMKFLASMPELCDVTFLVGDTREPVCAVKVSVNIYICIYRMNVCVCLRMRSKPGHCVIDVASSPVESPILYHDFFLSQAVLASRSRVFAKMLYAAPSPQRKRETTTKENKLRLFLKRSSEPLLNLQNAAQQVRSLKIDSTSKGRALDMCMCICLYLCGYVCV